MGGKEMAEFRKVEKQELAESLFDGFRRHQVVRGCLRNVQGKWVEKQDPFVDEWSQEDYRFLVRCLKETLESGGVVFGAFTGQGLKGFASVDGRFFGSKAQYLDLTSLHVSEEVRGQGIGTELFAMAALWAKRRGARKLYISSHSAVETQRFYGAMGCVDALECSKEHVRREPYDRQLELDLDCYKPKAVIRT